MLESIALEILRGAASGVIGQAAGERFRRRNGMVTVPIATLEEIASSNHAVAAQLAEMATSISAVVELLSQTHRVQLVEAPSLAVTFDEKLIVEAGSRDVSAAPDFVEPVPERTARSAESLPATPFFERVQAAYPDYEIEVR